jgi:S-(hydroxymethyl)glutathione dehydrogenase/alcohol dehydrogenase
LDKVCLLGCGISTGYGSALNVAKVKKGSSVAIWGLGGVGLSAVMGAKAAGAATIVGIDTNPEKFKTAMEFGATECINPNDLDKPIQLHVAEKYNGGFDFTIECVGNVKTMQTALECTHIGWGVNVVVGVGAQNTMIQVNPLLMVMGVQVRGSALGGLKGRDGIAELVGKYMNKEIKVDELITHTFKLDQINEAVENLRQGKGYLSINIITYL